MNRKVLWGIGTVLLCVVLFFAFKAFFLVRTTPATATSCEGIGGTCAGSCDEIVNATDIRWAKTFHACANEKHLCCVPVQNETAE